MIACLHECLTVYEAVIMNIVTHLVSSQLILASLFSATQPMTPDSWCVSLSLDWLGFSACFGSLHINFWDFYSGCLGLQYLSHWHFSFDLSNLVSLAWPRLTQLMLLCPLSALVFVCVSFSRCFACICELVCYCVRHWPLPIWTWQRPSQFNFFLSLFLTLSLSVLVFLFMCLHVC